MANLNKIALTLLCILLAPLAQALSLGELSVYSLLNQPLDAAIALGNVGQLAPAEISVKLADAAEFERAGIDREAVLSELQFEVLMPKAGTSMIKISSHQPVTSPYLNFLIEIQWPNGLIIRECTVLLNPPAAEQ